MRKLCFIVITICLLMLCTNLYYRNKECSAMSIQTYNYIICIDHFDELSNEYKEMFWDLDIPISFVTAHRDKYKFKQNYNKQFVDALAVPKNIMSIVANGDAKELRQCLYNNMNVAKKNGLVIIIFDIKNLDEENVFYAITDSIKLLRNNDITFRLYNYIYNN